MQEQGRTAWRRRSAAARVPPRGPPPRRTGPHASARTLSNPARRHSLVYLTYSRASYECENNRLRFGVAQQRLKHPSGPSSWCARTEGCRWRCWKRCWGGMRGARASPATEASSQSTTSHPTPGQSPPNMLAQSASTLRARSRTRSAFDKLHLQVLSDHDHQAEAGVLCARTGRVSVALLQRLTREDGCALGHTARDGSTVLHLLCGTSCSPERPEALAICHSLGISGLRNAFAVSILARLAADGMHLGINWRQRILDARCQWYRRCSPWTYAGSRPGARCPTLTFKPETRIVRLRGGMDLMAMAKGSQWWSSDDNFRAPC
eukprot:783369-Rhodomonas_salina.1